MEDFRVENERKFGLESMLNSNLCSYMEYYRSDDEEDQSSSSEANSPRKSDQNMNTEEEKCKISLEYV